MIARKLTCVFFFQNNFQKLPSCLFTEIFLWIPVEEFSAVPAVSKEWTKMSRSNDIWRVFFNYRFLRHNPGSLDLVPDLYIDAFRSRLRDPLVGDKVEVAWRGKFRLEASDVYQGLAWWVAEIVDNHPIQGKYKIRYPGWDSRWDEWVSRARLRWAVDKNTVRSLQINDVVEIWCCGAAVPGAWLESRIQKVRGDRFCVGKVLSTGSLWVERERLRPANKCISFGDQDVEANDSLFGERRSISRTRSLSQYFSHGLDRSVSLFNATDTHRNSCSIM